MSKYSQEKVIDWLSSGTIKDATDNLIKSILDFSEASTKEIDFDTIHQDLARIQLYILARASFAISEKIYVEKDLDTCQFSIDEVTYKASLPDTLAVATLVRLKERLERLLDDEASFKVVTNDNH